MRGRRGLEGLAQAPEARHGLGQWKVEFLLAEADRCRRSSGAGQRTNADQR